MLYLQLSYHSVCMCEGFSVAGANVGILCTSEILFTQHGTIQPPELESDTHELQPAFLPQCQQNYNSLKIFIALLSFCAVPYDTGDIFPEKLSDEAIVLTLTPIGLKCM